VDPENSEKKQKLAAARVCFGRTAIVYYFFNRVWRRKRREGGGERGDREEYGGRWKER